MTALEPGTLGPVTLSILHRELSIVSIFNRKPRRKVQKFRLCFFDPLDEDAPLEPLEPRFVPPTFALALELVKTYNAYVSECRPRLTQLLGLFPVPAKGPRQRPRLKVRCSISTSSSGPRAASSSEASTV